MSYGCKIMVSLTLCRFLDHPVDARVFTSDGEEQLCYVIKLPPI